MKKFLKSLCLIILGLIFLLITLIIGAQLLENFNYNYRYSIAMPTIIGEFNISDNYIHIAGLENIIGDNIASLTYSELYCIPSRKWCNENYFGIMGLGNQISIFPYNKEYTIKYIDNNKILFDNGAFISGEIDLNSKTLIYTIKNAGFEHNETRKIEVITNNKEIEKLEKKIIKKHLKRRMFK